MIFTREILPEILKTIDSHEIIFLLGTRRTGKTTLSKLIAENSKFKTHHYIDFEDKEPRTFFNTSNLSMSGIKYYFDLNEINYNSKTLIIFDEVQLLNDPSNILKLLHDHFPNLKIIATGSSSLSLKKKFSDSLAGRRHIYIINPLSFNEYLLFKNKKQLLKIREIYHKTPDDKSIIPLIKSYSNDFIISLNEYLIFGGYPEVVLLQGKTNKINKLVTIADAYINKDIREIAQIENIDAYNNLIKYLSINIASLFSLETAAKTIGISIPTIKKYIYLLKETFIIDHLLPFYSNKNKEISKNKKYFFKDTGIRNLQIKNFNDVNLRTDIGELYENYVFNALTNKNKTLAETQFYRTQNKTEIDFIFIENRDANLYEVKSGSYTKIPKALSEFEKKYLNYFNNIEKHVINQNITDKTKNVCFIPAYLF